MHRTAEAHLDSWRNRPDRKPLIVRGARQVGKTYLIQQWARANFEETVTVDLERERHLHSVFNEADPGRMLEEIGLLKRQRLVPGQALLFLDEIQACPRALAALRYFHEHLPALHVVAAGSLLDFALRDFTYSVPVGRVEFLFLYPLSFQEYLMATEGDELGEWLRTYRLATPIGSALQARLHEALRRYFFLGGMPEIVRAHSEGAPLIDIQRLQGALVQAFRDDLAKYGPRSQQDLLQATLQHAALNVGQKIKFVNISRDRRAADVRRALDLLTGSRVVHIVRHSSGTGVPLGATASDKPAKALFLDIGLVNHMCGLTLLPVGELLTVNEGALAEQFVGQELLCSGLPFVDDRLYYWHREARSANAEVDYLLSAGPHVLPVEVKAATGGALRSLFQFLRERRGRRAVRLYQGTAGVERLPLPGNPETTIELLSLPLFLAGQVRRLAEEFAADVATPDKTGD